MIGELVEFLALSLVSQPEVVEVKEVSTEKQVTVDLTVGRDDFGRVIGRNGQTIKAIRTLASVVASKNGVSATVNVIDPLEPNRRS